MNPAAGRTKHSLGLIETWGMVAAVEAADAAAKAAAVSFIHYERVEAGLVTVMFAGDVAAVRAAVMAGRSAAEKVGKVISYHVIARPDPQIPWLPRLPEDSPPEVPSVEESPDRKEFPGETGGERILPDEKPSASQKKVGTKEKKLTQAKPKPKRGKKS